MQLLFPFNCIDRSLTYKTHLSKQHSYLGTEVKRLHSWGFFGLCKYSYNTQQSKILLVFTKVHLEKNCGSTRSMLENSCLWQWTPTRCTPSQEKYPFLRAPQLQHGSQQQMKAPTASCCSRPGWSGYTSSSKGSEKEVLGTIWCFLRRDPQSAKGVHQQCHTRYHQYHPALLRVWGTRSVWNTRALIHMLLFHSSLFSPCFPP